MKDERNASYEEGFADGIEEERERILSTIAELEEPKSELSRTITYRTGYLDALETVAYIILDRTKDED